MRNLISYVFIVASLCATIKADYIAAVVEYAPLNDTTPNATVEANLREYIHFIERARDSNVQIIIFPEYGLTGLVEDPSEYAIEIPIGNGSTFQNYWLHSLSNAAREHSMYIVVNLLERAKSNNNDTIFYNTNIVYDRNGVIIAKYRKINLYLEPKITPGNETVTFRTDFGITFGIFTCFDILFHYPSRSILNETVTDIIFPTAWTSTLPFYHSLSVQSGYSQANKLNLLAANLNNPSQGISGSGIYAFDGKVLEYYLSGTISSKLIISYVLSRSTVRDETFPFDTFGFDILDNTTQSDLDKFIAPRDFQSSSYTFKDVDFSQGDVQESLCDGLFCCSFNISAIDANKTESFKLLTYNGPTVLGESNRNIKICTLIFCETSSTRSCGLRNIIPTTKFKEISVGAYFENHIDYFYQPVSLRNGLLPVFNTTFSSAVINETNYTSLKTTRPVEKVIVFGIFGRGSAPTFGSSFIFLAALFILNYLL